MNKNFNVKEKEFNYEEFIKEFEKEKEKDFFFEALENELKGDHSPFNEDFRS